VTVAAGTDYVRAPVAGGLYYVQAVGTPGLHVVEALDECVVSVRPGIVTVATPASVWLVYLLKGFVAGCLMELGGLAFRLFIRISGSSEAAP